MKINWLAIAFFISFSSTYAQQTTGPESGSLVVVGGALRDLTILERFVELAGGPNAPIVVVPTAGGSEEYDDSYYGMKKFRDAGATNLTLLHTTNPEEADSPAFAASLEEAAGVWFGGGRQWRLVDAYAGTRTEELFHAVLARGGVVGGSSAGATIQGSYLARGDTKNNQIMMGDHEEGFGFIKNIAIDQHVLARNRQYDLFSILDERPELLGIGIDENTAIVVQGNEFEVMGNSYVLIYDSGFWSREGSELKTLPRPERRFYLLRPGDKYNMKNREVVE